MSRHSRNHSNKAITRRVNWGILKGEPGCRGKRGHPGKRGHSGKDALLAFGYATNDVEQFNVAANTAVDFNNIYFPFLETNVQGNVLSLDEKGVYELNYSVRGISSNIENPMAFGLFNNGNLVSGSVNSLTSATNFIINGTVIAEITEHNSNIQLLNLSQVDSVSYVNTDVSNNAVISAKRLV
jgi:hypothetical protein